MGTRDMAGAVARPERNTDRVTVIPGRVARSPIAVAAYLAGCVASLVFVVSTLAPSFASNPTGLTLGPSVSFYDAVVRGSSAGLVATSGRYLFVYGGPLILATLGVWGLARSRRRRSGTTAFAGAGVAWGVTAMGLLLSQVEPSVSHGLGFVGMVVGACLAIVGGLVEAIVPVAEPEPAIATRPEPAPPSRPKRSTRRR
jgi:hypothetical protein